MFKSIIAQSSSHVIAVDILAGAFPKGALFYGTQFAGKLTAALETARVLSCVEGSGDEACGCSSCAAQKELLNPDTLIMGARSCSPEIRAVAASFLASPEPQLCLSFIRTVRKLTVRFSPVFAEGGDAKQAKAAPLLSDINEWIEQLSSINIDNIEDYSQTDRAGLEKLVAKIADAACKLDEGFLYSSIPVSAVRSVSSWLRVKPAGKAKVLVIEGADAMQDAARNALLKILEEPPEAAYFILTAQKRQAVMPTILSRVRSYPFVERSAAAQAEVLRLAFGAHPRAGETISSFINEFLPVKPAQIEACASRFLFTLFEGANGNLLEMQAMQSVLAEVPTGLSAITAKELSAALNGFKPAAVWTLFLSSLLDLIRLAVRNSFLTPRETETFRRWTRAIKQARDSVFVYNISPAASLERLDYLLRTCAA